MKAIKAEMIAPCGMNCGLCLHFLRAENKCPGCFPGRKVNGRLIKCQRRLCKKRTGYFCYECTDFPCESIKTLDKRYKERYGMSEVENLNKIKNDGMQLFLKEQNQKWVNKEGVFCVHDGKRYQSQR